MRAFIVALLPIALLLFAATASADQWVQYTDGRAGGCWLNRSGVLYGCTPQPPVSRPTQSQSTYERREGAIRQLQEENQQLQRQLEDQRAQAQQAQAALAAQQQTGSQPAISAGETETKAFASCPFQSECTCKQLGGTYIPGKITAMRDARGKIIGLGGSSSCKINGVNGPVSIW